MLISLNRGFEQIVSPSLERLARAHDDALLTGLIRTRKIWIVNMASIALISICVTAEQAYLCYRAGLANASAGGDNYRVFAWFSVSLLNGSSQSPRCDHFAVALGHLWTFRQHHLSTRQLQEQKHSSTIKSIKKFKNRSGRVRREHCAVASCWSV